MKCGVKMYVIYDLLFLIIIIFYLPVYLLRRKFHAGFYQRLGFLPANLKLDRPIWVHAVSVGEAKAVMPLIEGLRTAYPFKKFVISTVTATGNKIAASIAKEGDLVTYLPLDFSFIAARAVKLMNPSLFILAETEIWPNLIRVLAKKNIPVIIVNGRISDASFKGYLLVRPLASAILRKINLFCVQTERDSQRLSRLGVAPEKIRVTGNMKFDGAKISSGETKEGELRRAMGLQPADKILVAGSTHSPEEKIILGVYRSLSQRYPQLKLVIAPRHPERSAEVAKIASGFGFHSIFTSASSPRRVDCEEKLVFIIDSIGKLPDFYAIADVVFVGGSLIKKGGQNILEPAALAKAVIFGEHMFNFRDIAELFIENKAAVMARGARELEKYILNFLDNPAEAKKIGERAKGLIFKNQGATAKTVELIKRETSL